MSLDLDVNVERARRQLAFLELQLRDLRSFWPLLVPVFIGWMRQQFETEGEWGGRRWAPLSALYAARKAVKRPGRTILIYDGRLRRAASAPVRLATPTTLTLAIADPNAERHQIGTRRMPARPLIPHRMPGSAERDIRQVAEGYVAGLVARSNRI